MDGNTELARSEAEKLIDSVEVVTPQKLTKEERYKIIFCGVKESPDVLNMTNEQIAERINLLEITIADLMFEKRAEIQAFSDVLYERLESASEHERERIRKIDKRYTTERGQSESKKIEERKVRLSKKEEFVQKMMKAGVDRKKAESLAQNIK